MTTQSAAVVPTALDALAARLERAGLLVEVAGAAGGVEVRGISDDSRAVRPGDLFCAWAGTAHDSHAYAPAAADAGAVAVLVERKLPGAGVPQIVVHDGRRATAIAAAALHADPQAELLVVGITGTNGKTTSVWILRHLLSASYPTASLGTLGVVLPDGSTLPGSESLTTPGPVELARTLRLLVDRGVRAVAMEVSSHALAQGRVHALCFAAAAFTNLSRDHLDFHGTLDAYRDAKRSFTRLLAADGWVVYNVDDAAWLGIGDGAPHALSFGLAEHAEVRAVDIELGDFGARFGLATASGTVSAAVPLPGAFNVQNALAAASMALALGFSPQEVAARLATVPQVPGRLERIAERPCAVMRDYAHTPDALERVLAALRPLTERRLIVLFGAGGDRDRGKRPLMGAVAEQGADVAIVTSDNPRTEDADAIIDEIVTGMSEGTAIRITDRRAAIAAALAMADAGDIVLLAGKGHETYQQVGTQKFAFDERVIVGELLGEAGVNA